MRVTIGRYQVDDDPARIDAGAAVAFLTSEAYWGRWRGEEDIRQQIAASWRVVGGYDETGAMVGFARAVADSGSAYLSDVYVLREHRGTGLGKAIVRMMVDEDPGPNLRWMLHTSDAHGLYRSFGFARPNGRYLERPGGYGGAGSPPVIGGFRATGVWGLPGGGVPPELQGKVVRLEPLQPQHVAGLVAAASGGEELYRWSPVPQDEATTRGYVEAAIAARDEGTAVPFAVVRAQDNVVIGSTRFFDLSYWPWPEPRPEVRYSARHVRDRLQLAEPAGDQDRREHRDEAPHAHARLRGLAGAVGVPAHRRTQPALARGDAADRPPV